MQIGFMVLGHGCFMVLDYACFVVSDMAVRPSDVFIGDWGKVTDGVKGQFTAVY